MTRSANPIPDKGVEQLVAAARYAVYRWFEGWIPDADRPYAESMVRLRDALAAVDSAGASEGGRPNWEAMYREAEADADRYLIALNKIKRGYEDAPVGMFGDRQVVELVHAALLMANGEST